VFNGEVRAPRHLLYFEPTPKRIRVEFGGETIADSTGVHLLFETRLLPVYYFPVADVREDLLRRTDHTTHCPVKGDAAYWTVAAGGRTAENAVWGYPDPIAPWLTGYVAFYWDAMDAWYEEDERVHGHPHDPYSRIDVLRGSRHVTVRSRGTVLAASDRPMVLFETGLPVRYYLPREDVRLDLLQPSETRTWCAYKGEARYWSYDGVDVAWAYEAPLHDAERVRDMICFYVERVDIEVDGQD
jgi:uncharacterized protein (DUF427 family)